MLAREHDLFGCTRSKPTQSSVPAGLTLASEFGFCFQCQEGSSLVLRRPIEITRLIRHFDSEIHSYPVRPSWVEAAHPARSLMRTVCGEHSEERMTHCDSHRPHQRSIFQQ